MTQSVSRRAFPLSLSGLLLLLATGCGPSISSAEADHLVVLDRMRATYENYFDQDRPSYVYITMPGVVAQLPQAKQEEYQIIRKVLEDRTIRYETVRRSEILTKITVPSRKKVKEFWTFDLPIALAQGIHGGSVLYLNLDAEELAATVKNPRARQHEITIRILNDPIKVQKIRRVVG